MIKSYFSIFFLTLDFDTGSIGSEFYYGNDPNIFINFDYEGEVEITPEDIEEWHLKNDANKYNL